MNITLRNGEINKALIAYIISLGLKPKGKISINLIAGRGANGNSAVIELSEEDDAPLEETSPEEGKKEEIVGTAPMFGTD